MVTVTEPNGPVGNLTTWPGGASEAAVSAAVTGGP